MLLGYEEQSEGVKQSNSFWLGFVPVLAASILSGLAAALSQKALQGQKRGSYLFTSELALIPIVSQCSCCAHTRAVMSDSHCVHQHSGAYAWVRW